MTDKPKQVDFAAELAASQSRLKTEGMEAPGGKGTLRSMRAAQMAEARGARHSGSATGMPGGVPPPPPPRKTGGTLTKAVDPVSPTNAGGKAPPPLPTTRGVTINVPPSLPPKNKTGTLPKEAVQAAIDPAETGDGADFDTADGGGADGAPTPKAGGQGGDHHAGDDAGGENDGKSPNPANRGMSLLEKTMEKRKRPNLMTREGKKGMISDMGGLMRGEKTMQGGEVKDKKESEYENENDEDVPESKEPIIKYQRNATAEGNIPLAKTVRIIEEKAENRFVQDFVPPVRGGDPLVEFSLKNFSALTKSLVRVKPVYRKVKPKKARMLEYEVDVSKEKKVVNKKAKPAAALTDMFSAPQAENKETGAEGTEEKEEEEEVKVSDTEAAQQLLKPDLLKALSPDDAAKALQEEQGKAKEDGLFWRYHPEFQYTEPHETITCKRVPVNLWSRDLGTQLLITVQKLELHVGPVEPFFCTLCLYDLKAGVRMSENFHFDLNDPSVLSGQLEVSKSMADKITLARHSIFGVTDKHEDVVLILRVERVLQGEPDNDLWLKVKKRTPAEIDTLKKKVKAMHVYLSEYRQPFCWGILPLFEDTGDFKKGTPERMIDKLFLQNESCKENEFIEMAREAHKGNDKKLRQIPSSFFQLRIDELADALPPNRVDPSSIALKDTQSLFQLTDLDEKEPKPIVKEIEEFMDKGSMQCIPHTFFMNLLYIYPESVKFDKSQNVCITVQIRNSDVHPTGDGLKVIPGKSSMSAFTTSLSTQVNYHKKVPTPHDEIKIMLPLTLSPTSHLFFTFSKISCKKKPGKKETLGYCCLPLFTRARVPYDDVYSLPIAEKLPKNYLQPYVDGKEVGDLTFLHKGEKDFKVRLKLSSSIFNQDPGLNDFFYTLPADKELLANKDSAEPLVKKAVEHLGKVDPFVCIKFMPPLLNFMNELIVNRLPQAKLAAFLGAAVIVNKVAQALNEGNRCALVIAYLTHRLDNPVIKAENTSGIPLFLQVGEQWLKAMELSATKSEQKQEESEIENAPERLAIVHAWYFFELIIKSMILVKQEKGSLSDEQQTSFCDTFKQTLGHMVKLLYRHRSTGLTPLKHLINNLALFFTDLFCVMERERAVDLIAHFLHEFKELNDDPVLVEFKFTFYNILLDSEYFMDICDPHPLELPEGTDIIDHIKTKHRIPPILIEDVIKQITTLEEIFIKEKVVNTLRLILTKWDYDARLQDVKPDIALMFLPMIPELIQNVDAISQMENKLRRNVLVCLLWVLKHVDRKVLAKWWDTDEFLADFIQLLELCHKAFPYMGVKHREADQEFDSILSPESMSSFTEGNTSTGHGTMDDLKYKIEAMMDSVHVKGASFRSKMVQARGRNSTLGGSTKSLLATQNVQAPGGTVNAGGKTLRQMRATMAGRRTGTFKKGGNTLTVSSREYLMKLVRWEGALSHASVQIVLQTLANLLDDKQAVLKKKKKEGQVESCSDLLLGSLSLLTEILKLNHSTPLLMSFYPTLRLFIQRFGDFMFSMVPVHRVIPPIGGHLLHHCTFYSQEVRSYALAMIYQLLRCNFSREGKLTELEVSLTTYLSKMVADLSPRGEKFLKQALIALPDLHRAAAWDDESKKKQFAAALDTLLGRLNTILGDSMEITRQTKLGDDADPTTSEALLMQVADAFSHMPETRVTWLNRLAEHHKRIENFAEAGQCYLAIARLCKEKHVTFGLPPKTDDDEEPAEHENEDKVAKSEAMHLDLACKMLDKAELYEQCYEVYKGLLGYYEKKRDYKRLSHAHQHLHDIFDKLIEANKKQTRMLGTYYRVGFYGRKFGPRLDGNEFVYKLPKITRLMEVSSQLKNLYSRQLGCPVKVFPDSGPVNRTALDAEECWLQVTFVNAYFAPEETKKRQMFIDKTTGLHAFTFSTPFTKGGQAFGSVAEQYKRNAVVHVRDPFPCCMTIQPILRRDETILSPIQSACEDVDERVRRLTQVLDAGNVDPKALTAILAGSVATQVHGGAKEVCLAFLADAPPEEPTGLTIPGSGVTLPPLETKKAPAKNAAAPAKKDDHHDDKEAFDPEEQEKLRKSMRDFLAACRRGLDENKKISNASQSETEKSFQANLDKQYDDLCTVIRPLIKERKKKIARKNVRFN